MLDAIAFSDKSDYLFKNNLLKHFLRGNALGDIFIQLSLTTFTGDTEICAHLQTTDRLLRVLAACRLFEMENQILPTKLEDLVPSYLPNIPKDPFNGKALRYDVDRKIIYSIGKNLRDDGGDILSPDAEKYDDSWSMRAPDLGVRLGAE